MTSLPRITLLPAALTLLFAFVPAAHATDSHAPKGARADWLVDAEWVKSSWLSYDESRLELPLHTTRTELSHWLDDRRRWTVLSVLRGSVNPLIDAHGARRRHPTDAFRAGPPWRRPDGLSVRRRASSSAARPP